MRRPDHRHRRVQGVEDDTAARRGTRSSPSGNERDSRRITRHADRIWVRLRRGLLTVTLRDLVERERPPSECRTVPSFASSVAVRVLRPLESRLRPRLSDESEALLVLQPPEGFVRNDWLPMTDATLARARAGDIDAFSELTDPYRRELEVHCYRILESFQDVDDLLQVDPVIGMASTSSLRRPVPAGMGSTALRQTAASTTSVTPPAGQRLRTCRIYPLCQLPKSLVVLANHARVLRQKGRSQRAERWNVQIAHRRHTLLHLEILLEALARPIGAPSHLKQ